MQFVRLQNQQDKFYEEAIALYERNFIVSERRDADEQRRIMQRFDYHFEIILDANRLCGFILYWETNSFIYLEHLCIHEQFRGRGIGSSALNYLKGKEKTIILEVEPIVDEITDRRKVFYESNGFFLNTHKHIQVKYRREDSDVMLLIMTSDREISSGEYDNFYEYMVNNVQISEPNVSSITVEKAKQEDDFSFTFAADGYYYNGIAQIVHEKKNGVVNPKDLLHIKDERYEDIVNFVLYPETNDSGEIYCLYGSGLRFYRG